MKSSSKKRNTANERKLAERIKELEEKLAASVPRSEFETVKSNLQLEINDLQTRLSDSVPRADLEYVKNELQRICDLEGRIVKILTQETEELRTRISELEKLFRTTGTGVEESVASTEEIQAPRSGLSESSSKGEAGVPSTEEEDRFMGLQQALSSSKKETEALRERISEMEPPTDEPTTESSEESEVSDSEDTEDSETTDSDESESTESYIQSQITDK